MKNSELSGGQIKKWAGRGFLSISDQVIYSGSNFVLLILLARWLDPVDFGAFSVTYALMSFFYQLHNGLICEPMNVLGPANYPACKTDYVSVQTRLHFLFTTAIGLTLIAVILIFPNLIRPATLNILFIFLGASAPFLLLPWLIRRSFYFLNKPLMAAMTSLQYAFFLLVILFIARQVFELKSTSIYIIMAGAALLSSAVFFIFIRRHKGAGKLKLSQVLKQNWRYGKWIMLNGLLVSLAIQIQLFITGSSLGLEEAAAFKVLQNFNQPMVVVISGLSFLFLPSFASQIQSNHVNTIRKRGRWITLVTVALAAAYFGLLLFLKGPLELLLYEGKYQAYIDLIPLLGIVPIITALTLGPSVLIRAYQKPQSLLIVGVVWACVSVLTSFLFIHSWGIVGAVWSVIIGQTVATVMLFVLSRWSFNV
jgi:O-antigen/teichoic acid export membrane protein